MGDLDLKLRNALRRGEAVDLNWRRLADRTQDLRLASPIRTSSTRLRNGPEPIIFRQDTTFLGSERACRTGVPTSPGDKLSVFVNSRTSDKPGRPVRSHSGPCRCGPAFLRFAVLRERLDYRLTHAVGMPEGRGLGHRHKRA